MTTNKTRTETVEDEKVKKSAKDSHACTTTQEKETSPTDASQTTLKFRAETKKRVYHFSSDSSEDDAVSDHNSDDVLIVSPSTKATKTTKTKKQAVDEVSSKKTAASKTKKQLSIKVTSVKTDTKVKKPVTKGTSSKEPSKETVEIGDDLCIIDEEPPAKKSTKTKSTKAKAGKRKVSDPESDSEAPVVPIVQSPVRSKRSGKKVKYYFSDDDNSDFDP